MKHKPIYLDGVDVAGCDFYDKDKGYCLTLKMYPKGFKNPSCFSGDFQECIQDCKTCPYTFCDSNSNCYYKQLVRRTKECEELKPQIDADYECYSQQLKILRNIIENKEKRNARLFVISNNYRKALEKIEQQCKCYGRSKYTQEFDREYGGELGTNILDIIDKLKE